MLRALYATEDTLLAAFRTGEGVGWDALQGADQRLHALTAASVAICPPSATARHGSRATGNHAGDGATREIAEAGPHHRRLTAQSPVDRIHTVGR